MAVDDLWFSSKRDADGQRQPTRRHGRGKRWRVRFTDDTGQKAERLFERKSEAERFDASARTDVARGQYIDDRAGRVTVRTYAEQWATAQLYRRGTADRVERTMRLHVFPVLGALALAAVRPTHIQQWIKGLDLAPSSARTAYATVTTMFAAAVRDRLIAGNPCTGARLPALPEGEHLILTPAQVHTIAAGIGDRFRATVYLGAGCGLRNGEALGLLVDDVDFLRRELHVRQQLCVQPGAGPYLGELKTSASRRTVELPSVVAEALARHIAEHPPALVDVLDRTDPRNERTRPARLLFTTTQGRPIHRAHWSRLWRPGRDAAGLPAGTGYHVLRHYFATLLIHSGASVKTVQTALGHSTPTVTLDTYVGLWPDAIDRTRNLVDAALAVAPIGAVSS